MMSHVKVTSAEVSRHKLWYSKRETFEYTYSVAAHAARRSFIEIPFTRIGVFKRSYIRLHITSVLYIAFWSLSRRLNCCCYGTDLERSRVSSRRLS